MSFSNYFADAESSYKDAEFVIFGIPYDKTSSFRHGARKAPKEIRHASWNFETYNIRTGVDLRDIMFHDYGDIDVSNDDSPGMMVEKVRNFTSKLLEKNKFPIAIGGEHSLTAGVVQAFPEDITVLSLDAHIDFRESYENERFNHACVMRRLADHIKINDIAVFGIRSAEKEEFEYAKKSGLFYIDAFTIKDIGLDFSLDKVKKHLKNKKIYMTLDIDVVDPAYAPGTSTPEPFGLAPLDICCCIDSFSSQLVGFDIVEVCPDYDNGQTALLAAKFIRYVIEKVWSNR